MTHTHTKTSDNNSRNTVCLDCRTALGEGEACDGGKGHRTANLHAPEGREQLLREVWGPPGLRRKVKRMAAAGGSGAVAGGLLECGGEVGCGLLDCVGAGEFAPAAIVILVAAGAAVLLYLLVAFIVHKVRERRSRIKPNGALRPPLPRGRRVSGTIAADAPTVPTLSGEQAAAFGLRLTTRRFLRSDVMLLDGVSAGFSVALADGREVRVPAGRVRVEGPAARGRALSAKRVASYLRGLDPLRRYPEAAEELEPIPFDVAREHVLRPGEPVELVAELELVPDPSGGELGYRDAAAGVLVPRGPVVLRPAPRR
jgi:hypothetical protein